VLLEGLQQEVEEGRPGLSRDVPPQRRQGGLAALDQLGDDRRIGLDRGSRAVRGRSGDLRRLFPGPVRIVNLGLTLVAIT